MTAWKLSGECITVLDKWDMYAEPSDGIDKVSVRNEEGAYLFTVSTAISAEDLMHMLMYADRMRSRGQEEGREAFKSSLRYLLGVAAEPKEQP